MPAMSRAQTPAEELAALASHVDLALAQLDAGDIDAARTAYVAFDDGWAEIEDGIRAQSRESYRSIEDAMAGANSALHGEPVDVDAARAALQLVRQRCDTFIQG
jgi:hypothetical protein